MNMRKWDDSYKASYSVRSMPRNLRIKQRGNVGGITGDGVSQRGCGKVTESQNTIDNLINSGKYEEALILIRKLIEEFPGDAHYLYLAGQCCRFLNDFNGAISYLKSSADLSPVQQEIFLALGIAYQLNENFEQSVYELNKAIEIDPTYTLAFNSIALTRKRVGDLEKSSHAFDEAAKALAKCLCMDLVNAEENPIFRYVGSRNELWAEYAMFGAMFGAMFHAANEDDIDVLAWPTGEMALREESSHVHRGLFWKDSVVGGRKTGLFLPNFFNTFESVLRSDRSYANIIGDRGLVLKMQGDLADARKHEEEFEDFMLS